MFDKIFNLPRWLLAGLSSSVLIVLIIFSTLQGSKSENDRLNQLNHPKRHLNEEISLGFLKISKVNRYEISGRDSQRQYQLISNPSMNIREGDTYSFTGMITASGKIRLTEMQHHPHRLYKYLISGSAFLFVFNLIIKNIRIQKKGWLSLVD
jgi:hypothetical protein